MNATSPDPLGPITNLWADFFAFPVIFLPLKSFPISITDAYLCKT
jgi:hypothetical protein